jgi:hypothetical protein
MDKGYGKVSWVNLQDVNFALSCKAHPDERPMELDIEHNAEIPRCPKCNQPPSAPVAQTPSEELLQVFKTTLKKIINDKKSPVELRMEFSEQAIQERDR